MPIADFPLYEVTPQRIHVLFCEPTTCAAEHHLLLSHRETQGRVRAGLCQNESVARGVCVRFQLVPDTTTHSANVQEQTHQANAAFIVRHLCSNEKGDKPVLGFG